MNLVTINGCWSCPFGQCRDNHQEDNMTWWSYFCGALSKNVVWVKSDNEFPEKCPLMKEAITVKAISIKETDRSEGEVSCFHSATAPTISPPETVHRQEIIEGKVKSYNEGGEKTEDGEIKKAIKTFFEEDIDKSSHTVDFARFIPTNRGVIEFTITITNDEPHKWF